MPLFPINPDLPHYVHPSRPSVVTVHGFNVGDKYKKYRQGCADSEDFL
jgi:hypothetical protein